MKYSTYFYMAKTCLHHLQRLSCVLRVRRSGRTAFSVPTGGWGVLGVMLACVAGCTSAQVPAAAPGGSIPNPPSAAASAGEGAAASTTTHAQSTSAHPATGAASAVAATLAANRQQHRWLKVPRVLGRIGAAQLGLVINTADPYSVEVGEYYRKARHIPEAHVLRVELPVQSKLSVQEVEKLRQRIQEHFDPEVQGLALAWTQPYAVECQSITAAVTLGVDPQVCQQPCGRRSATAYFNAMSAQPFRDHHLRPSMLLASNDVEQAKRLIDRGVASDGSLGLRGAVPARAYFMSTTDAARNVRASLFPPPGFSRSLGLEVHVEQGDTLRADNRVVLLQTGLAQLGGLENQDWVAGALADHLTSYAGQLDRSSGQSTVLDWLGAGVTASYGNVSEPCNHPQKFPHPQILLLHYVQGSTALEAYWKSVAWPQQGLFVGEPLAAPYARP